MARLGRVRDALVGQVFVVEMFGDGGADLVMLTDYTRTTVGTRRCLCVSVHKSPGRAEWVWDGESCYQIEDLKWLDDEEDEDGTCE